MRRSRTLIRHLTSIVARQLPDQHGQDLSEYAVIMALVAVVVIGVVILLGNSFSSLLGEIASEVGP